MNIKDIKELILTIDKTSINRVDIETADIKISISKSDDIILNNEKLANEIESEGTKKEVLTNEDITNDEDIFVVKSPIVGTFYTSPSPGAEPFVKAGDKVEEGQTLCIIEAMKIMNEITSEVSGEIVEILVENEEVVEYGQPLMKIRR
ncbi:acetyl-CoA carboxylase biotin carboxyl carrier protein [Caloranaerobacter azorensis]|uniref:Biotin carboxyl carrier protein of acetyl-CoA carboxylase n=2 Tax=Caloranaerobacter azorensis TaxID=116090 RepID=A0A1M5RHA5_9FIRM|nr:acetyl-CoA carboxylase biotin carboxyl carrier protein [Caloranaerobacter azorensis]QIB28034.1 acetyl-CoA carboxylase biotin carboxyl carrier protein [Caloranaerobacter azorensis]SHH25717.1 acetyl-CoA carboxylase biotin carboxyl carrier protein [Caloranaerobacter azorensis DSM 13643]